MSAKKPANPPFDPSNRIDPVFHTGRLRVPHKNNIATAGEGTTANLNLEIVGRRNRLIVGANCRLKGHILISGEGLTVTIGDHTTFADVYIMCHEADVTIGRWCMFSRQVEIRTSDSHSLIDRETGKRINPAGPVTIGDHVWLGVGVLISKGVTIAEDNMVGAGAFVNKSMSESGTVIVGSPAEVKRRGVTWHRKQQAQFTQEELGYWRE